MAVIDSKFAYIKKRETFEGLIDTIPEGLNPIVFIEDTLEMWTCGTYFSIGYPSIQVGEESGSVKVSIGNSFFQLSTTGDSISIRRAEGNKIILSSSALNSITTEAPLRWDYSDKKLVHNESEVTPGFYGTSSNSERQSSVTVPYLSIDKYGHIASAENKTVVIRDYVEQTASSSILGDRPVLISYEDNTSTDTNPVRKANGLTFNSSSQRLSVAGGIDAQGGVSISGGLYVTSGKIVGELEGSVTGTATPKVHLSSTPDYGGASLSLYGHVLLQDILPTSEPDSSSSNTETTNTSITAVAASPLMVWRALEEAKSYSDNIVSVYDAMLFKGSITAGSASNSTYTPRAEVGHTYVVTFDTNTYNYIDNVGYINGVKVEVGDLFICHTESPAGNIANKDTIAENWTIVQTNNTGVVSGPTSAYSGQLAMFSNSTGKLITGVNSGTNGQILSIQNGMPSWIDPTIDTWRPINYIDASGTTREALSSSIDNTLTIKGTGNLKLEWDSTNNILTFNASSDNTWRPILAYNITSTSPVTIGDNSLTFSSDFLLVDGELVEGWAIVDELGNITYSR